MGHWTPTGVEPKDYDDDDEYVNSMCIMTVNSDRQHTLGWYGILKSKYFGLKKFKPK